ncbi:hypothetical protein CPB86DRAFT_763068 [Serendipita vermifera]|nr:hypothetical protein CPB86DRAFT_763068 [Serendipita vermifera]
MALRSAILKNAVTLVPTLGFTRTALVQAASNVSTIDTLPERTLDNLFGRGDQARKTLVQAWLEQGRKAMGEPGEHPVPLETSLRARLEWNVPVLDKLPEAFALLATPEGILPPISAKTILEHPAVIAHTACRLAQNNASGPSWYAQRASLATIYAAAELHQLTSPETATRFLEDLLETNTRVSNSISDLTTFVGYMGRSWIGIARSKGLLS